MDQAVNQMAKKLTTAMKAIHNEKHSVADHLSTCFASKRISEQMKKLN